MYHRHTHGDRFARQFTQYRCRSAHTCRARTADKVCDSALSVGGPVLLARLNPAVHGSVNLHPP